MRSVVLACIPLVFLAFPVAAPAAITYDIAASSTTGTPNGIQFSPLGGPTGDLIVTNTLTLRDAGPSTPLYLDFGVGYGHADSSGNVFYTPRNDVYQLYILTQQLLAPPSSVVANAVFVGPSEAVNLGGGRYEFRGDLLGAVGPAGSTLDVPGAVDLVFDVTRPLGRQVEGGTVTFNSVAVPCPPAWLLVVVGLGCRVVRRTNYRRNP